MTRTWRADAPHLVNEPGVAHSLRVMLVAIVASALAISAVTLILRWPLVSRLALVAAVTGIAALVLSHSGRIRPAMFIALLGITYAVMHAAMKNDGVQSVGLAIVPVLIVVASLLLDGLQFVLFTGAAILATMGMLAMRYWVLRLEPYSTGDLGDFFIFAVTCVTTALVGRMLAGRLQEGFRLIRASENRYRRIFENIQDVYYELRPDGILLEMSPSGAALFGVPPSELIGRPLAPFCIDPSECEALFRAVRTAGRVSNRELILRNSAAGIVHVLVSSVLIGESGEERMIGSIRDITERRRAEEALRESEARLRLALEATGAGTFDFYPQSKELICSEIAKRHFGMAPETELARHEILPAVHPDDRQSLLVAWRAAAVPEGGGQLDAEFRTIGMKDGRERWVAARGRMQFDAHNRPVRLIGTTREISERKRLEEELRRRAEELQKIMDCAPVALFVAQDADCREVVANRMAHAMLELPDDTNSPSAPGGRTPPRPFFRGDIEVPIDELPLQTAARGVEVRDSELEVLLPSGRRRLLWGHATPLRDAEGRARGAIAAVQDVTEVRQRTDALLRESEQRFRASADSAPVIIWYGDTAKRLTFVNEQYLRFTGLPEQQLLGHGWKHVIHPDDLERAGAVYYEGVNTRASYQVEYRARRADGEYRHMLGTTRPRYIGNDYVGQMGSVVDITDLKRRQEQDAASQKLESVGLLASGVAHDFNNLLGSIVAQTELGLSEIATGNRPEQELKRIEEVARRGAEIVRQLMIYAGQESETPAAIDVSQVVKDMLELLNISASKHAALETDLASDLPSVRADAAQIRQIVMNLVTNASEAVGDRDGVIHVTTTCAAVKAEMIGMNGERLAEGDYVQLEVSDTGCGMSPEARAKIFEPFFSTKAAGRGLGLAVVQGMVRSIGGAIEVVSEPGRGTTFRVFLPCNQNSAPWTVHATERQAEESGAPQRGSILMVEDEQILRESVAKMLRKKGFFVIEAGDGTAALEVVRNRKPAVDILFLDLTLPGPSSGAVLEETRRLMPDARVIVTSAYSEDAAAAELHAEVEHFIRKPYRLDRLMTTIKQALAG